MERLLRLAFKPFFRRGNLQVTTAQGSTFRFGDGSGPKVAVRFTTRAAQRQVLLDPELHLGETYMDGTFVVDEGSIADFLGIALGQNRTGLPPQWARPHWALRYLNRRLRQFNAPSRAKRNVAHHYDLDGRLYSLFLDADQQYSCAYFDQPDLSLDDAQLAKKRHVAAKLLVEPDARVLDIGSGWGGLALYLAEYCGANVTGVTLSKEQLQTSRMRAVEKKMDRRIEFRLQDYRDIHERFDRIVSVGMFEHVGLGFYDAYFRKCFEMLKDDGVMLLHAIGRSEGPNVTNPWIGKYIFPGGYIPALSEVLPAIERAGLLVTDIEILRLHYAETIRHWRKRFLAHREDAERLYDSRFVRMWEFYLAASEMAFREQAMMVFQIQLAKRQDVVPMTRNYMTQREAQLRLADSRRAQPLRLAGE